MRESNMPRKQSIDLQTLKDALINKPESDPGKIWRNGRAFYAQGMVMDIHELGEILSGSTKRHQDALTLLLIGRSSPLDIVIVRELIVSQQMHLLWQPVQDGHVHREATALENTRLALELALKAVLTRCSIRYERKHDLFYLWELLEKNSGSLIDEIREESKLFHTSYARFTTELRSLQDELDAIQNPMFRYDMKIMSKVRLITKEMDSLVMSSSYSYLPNGYSPSNDAWLDDFLDEIEQWRNHGPQLWTYLRYGEAIEDDMPLDIVRSVHLMARFMYEHLVPIPRQLKEYMNSPHRLWPDSLEEFWESRVDHSRRPPPRPKFTES